MELTVLNDAQKIVRAIEWTKEIINPEESRHDYIRSISKAGKVLSPETEEEKEINLIMDQLEVDLLKSVENAKIQLELRFKNL